MEKKISYEVISEYGKLKFYRYRKLIDFLLPYWPKWLFKMRVYKVINGVYYSGQFTNNTRWPVRFN